MQQKKVLFESKTISIIILAITFFFVGTVTLQTIGLLTVTHSRSAGNIYFKKYLKRYAQMECDFVSQISIVWNNPDDVEDTDILYQQPLWKRPVYFHKTQFDSMSFRFQLPIESTAKLFFVIDDDVIISCEELKNGFKKWKQYSADGIGPLTGYVPRPINFNIQENSFGYITERFQFYSFILVGATFISKEYIQLFNSDNQDAIFMIQHAREVKNCDDLMMNFLVARYYPHFIPRLASQYPIPYRRNGFLLTDGPHAVSRGPSYLKVRNQCIIKFCQKLGFIPFVVCPLQIQSVQSSFWKIPQPIQLKIKAIAVDPIRVFFNSSTKIINNDIDNQFKEMQTNPIDKYQLSNYEMNQIKQFKQSFDEKIRSMDNFRSQQTKLLTNIDKLYLVDFFNQKIILNIALLVFNSVSITILCFLKRKNRNTQKY